jgi:hypothetical protein
VLYSPMIGNIIHDEFHVLCKAADKLR